MNNQPWNSLFISFYKLNKIQAKTDPKLIKLKMRNAKISRLGVHTPL